MLPAFVIGLREGLETVVILGAIGVFLRVRDRRDLLRRIWRASALAAAICLAVALVIRFVEINLPWRQQDQLETVVGVAAVCVVTYMVVWMRRFPKDLQRDSASAAASALAHDSGRALVVLAFFAVLREGFEIAVFVTATIGLSGDNAWLATAGALLGVLAALAVGIGIVRGSRHIDITRFFRVTALVLVLSAAGIAMATVHSANAAGWITFGQTPQFDLSWLAPPGSVLSSITTGMFGIQPYPVIVEIVAWLAYFVPMVAVVLWPRRPATVTVGAGVVEAGVAEAGTVAAGAVEAGAPSDEETSAGRSASPSLRRKGRWIAVSGAAVLIAAGVATYLATSGPGVTQPGTRPTTTPQRTLYATLDDVVCTSDTRCVAVGDFLPVDKDALTGDPDGDGRATHTLVEEYDGRAWGRLASPDEGHGGAVLSSVSCPTANACVAVGSYRPELYGLQMTTAPPSKPLIESYNGRGWRLQASPPVAPNSVLSGVSCPTATRCVAVGTTTTDDKNGPLQSFFVEEFDGRSWTVTPTSSPPGSSSGLSAVSCSSAESCVAVGNQASRSNPLATRPLIEELDAHRWGTSELPDEADGPGILYDVTCVGADRCIAVGTTGALRSSGSALVLDSTGSTWSIDLAALQQAGDASLTSISCADEADCVVAGTSLLSLSDSPVGVLARLDGTGWETLGSTSGRDHVEAVACPAVTRCLGVGSLTVDNFGHTTVFLAILANSTWAPLSTPAP